MILVSLDNIRKHFGPEAVLDGVTFDVRPGERVALIGPNGTGKTTLLRIIAGKEEADGGNLALHRSARCGFLEQQVAFTPGRTVWQEARSALDNLVRMNHEAERLAAAMSEADEGERVRLGQRFDHLQSELKRLDGYQLDHKIERVLEGLGFTASVFEQPVHELSGGQRNRLVLARLLLEGPDLLLLDEPSNHLDLEASEWLEEYLIATSQTLIVVSHDRYFLDRVTNRTLELFRGTVDSYAGNYSAYRRQKGERLEVARRTYEKQQAEIEKLEMFIRKFQAGQKHAQAEDRRKKLERIERIDPPREIGAPPMGFPQAARSGDIVLRAIGLAKAFDRPLFADLSFDVERGERWGILGPNGCGKTTLLRCLVGDVTPDAGQVVLGTGVKLGYFDQLLQCLAPEALVVDAIRPAHKEFVEGQRRDLLARFGITGDMVFHRVASLSGGERNRVALAMLAASDANLLILDEPTNHLDLWARDALEQSLKAFSGTVLFVSHDRFFLNRVADHLMVVEPQRLRLVDGNYDTYQMLVGGQPPPVAPGAEPPSAKRAGPQGAPAGNEATSSKKQKRTRKFPYRKSAEIEAELAEREARVEELHQQLAAPDVVRSGQRVREIKADLDAQAAKIASLYEHWEEAVEYGD